MARDVRVRVVDQVGFINNNGTGRAHETPGSNQGGFITHDRQPPAPRHHHPSEERDDDAVLHAAWQGAMFEVDAEGVLTNTQTQTQPLIVLSPSSGENGASPWSCSQTRELRDRQSALRPPTDLLLLCQERKNPYSIAGVREIYRQLQRHENMCSHVLVLPPGWVLARGTLHDAVALLEEHYPGQMVFAGTERPDDSCPSLTARELLRHVERRECGTAPWWRYPRLDAWGARLENALAFYEQLSTRPPTSHWMTHFMEHEWAVVDAECHLFQDLQRDLDVLGNPFHHHLLEDGTAGLPVSVVMHSTPSTDMYTMERNLHLLHSMGMRDVVVWHFDDKLHPFATSDFPWVKVIHSDRNFGHDSPLSLAPLVHHETLLLQSSNCVLGEELIKRLYHKFERSPRVLHGIQGEYWNVGAQTLTITPQSMSGCHVVQGHCVMLHKRYAALYSMFVGLTDLRVYRPFFYGASAVGDGHDIILSAIARAASGKLNEVHHELLEHVEQPYMAERPCRAQQSQRQRLYSRIEQLLHVWKPLIQRAASI